MILPCVVFFLCCPFPNTQTLRLSNKHKQPYCALRWDHYTSLELFGRLSKQGPQQIWQKSGRDKKAWSVCWSFGLESKQQTHWQARNLSTISGLSRVTPRDLHIYRESNPSDALACLCKSSSKWVTILFCGIYTHLRGHKWRAAKTNIFLVVFFFFQTCAQAVGLALLLHSCKSVYYSATLWSPKDDYFSISHIKAYCFMVY